MRSTRFRQDHAAPIPDRATGYTNQNATWRIADSLLDVSGDGGIYSTVEDMLRWAAAFEKPEFAPLLSRMQTPGTLIDGRAIANGYGMGLTQRAYRGLQTVSHSGGGGGYSTFFLRAPAEKLTVVTLCNNGGAGAGRLAHMVVELYASAAMTASPAVSPAAPAQGPPRMSIPRELGQAAAGAFYSAELDATYRLVASSDGLSVEVGNNAPTVLSLIGPDRLGWSNRELTLVRNGVGVVTGLMLNSESIRDVAFTKR
jgi:CubicO group peptidase (beta-lactamase class C family)